MKRIATLAICLALQTGAWALGGYASLAGDEKKVADALKTNLAISEDEAYKIFDGYLKGYLDTKDWHYNTFNNESIKLSRLAKSGNKSYHLNFVTDNRFINVSLLKFEKERQVMIQTIETLPRSTSVVLDKHRALKSDDKYEADVDKGEFSSFTSKGFTSKVKMIVYSGAGAIQYVDMHLHDLGSGK